MDKSVDLIALMSALLGPTLPLTLLAQSTEDLRNDAATTSDVLTYGMGYSQQRYSPLTQINRQTVERLVPAWSYSMADNLGEEAQPLVKDGGFLVEKSAARSARICFNSFSTALMRLPSATGSNPRKRIGPLSVPAQNASAAGRARRQCDERADTGTGLEHQVHGRGRPAESVQTLGASRDESSRAVASIE